MLIKRIFFTPFFLKGLLIFLPILFLNSLFINSFLLIGRAQCASKINIDDPARKSYFSGISAYHNQNYDTCLTHFEKADKAGIDDPEMFFRMAHIHEMKNNRVLAAKYFLIAADRFEKHDPKNPLHALSYNNLGAVLIKMNKSKAAEAALKRAKKLAPADTFQLFNLAALFTNSAEYNQAVRCYNLILLLDPDNKDAYLARVRCLAHGGNTEDAMTSLETFLKYNPKHAQAVYNLGILYMQSGFFAKATLEFEKALSLGLKDPRVYINLGLLAQIYDKDRYRAKAYYRKYLAMGGKEKDLVAKMIKNLYKPRPEKNKEKNKENEKKKKTGPDNKYTAPDFNIGF